MGCRNSIESNEKIIIRTETIDLIQNSWKDFNEAGSLADHGINLVIRLFTTHPEVKYIWSFALDLKTEQEMRQNGRLKYHGKRLMETIGVAVKSIQTLDVLDVLLIELGSRHFAYGTKPEHFALIKEVFIYIFSTQLKEKFTPEVANAWQILFEYITKKMLEGMQDCASLDVKKH